MGLLDEFNARKIPDLPVPISGVFIRNKRGHPPSKVYYTAFVSGREPRNDESTLVFLERRFD
jgi:hypothetical protein